MSERKQKNLRLDEEYHDKLENLAEEWFNSKKKQGQVVEKLVDLHGDDDLEGMVSAIYDEVVTDSTENSTHTEEQNTTSVADEIETKAKNSEFINLQKYDLTKVKNSRSVDKALIFGTIAQQQMDKIGFDKSDIRDMIVERAGYGYNGANEIAGSILTRFAVDLPDIVEKYESMINVNQSINDYLRTEVDISNYVWTEEEKKTVVKSNVKNLIQGSSPAKSNLTDNLAHWYDSQTDFDINIPKEASEDDKLKGDKIAENDDIYSAVNSVVPKDDISQPLDILAQDLVDEFFNHYEHPEIKGNLIKFAENNNHAEMEDVNGTEYINIEEY